MRSNYSQTLNYKRYKDGSAIEKSDNITIEVKNKAFNVLTIKSVEKANVGKYTMIAKNEIGEAEHSIQLNIDGKLKHLRLS